MINQRVLFSLRKLDMMSCRPSHGSALQLMQQLLAPKNQFQVCTTRIVHTREALPCADEEYRNALSGNKALKLFHFYDNYETKYRHVRRVISRGGNFSNAMYAIYQMCLDHGWQFIYYTDEPSSDYWMTTELHGSTFGKVFLSSRDNNMTVEMRNIERYESDVVLEQKRDDTLIVERGGASIEAKQGVDLLGEFLTREIGSEPTNILLPSGTGTTSLFLSRYLSENQPMTKLWTVPCVGRTCYLYDQMQDTFPDRAWIETNIHCIESKSKFRRFAQPHPQVYHFWKEFKELYDIELDLIYAPKTLLSFVDKLKEQPELAEQKWIYIHTGGEAGNVSQLRRYSKQQIRNT